MMSLFIKRVLFYCKVSVLFPTTLCQHLFFDPIFAYCHWQVFVKYILCFIVLVNKVLHKAVLTIMDGEIDTTATV